MLADWPVGTRAHPDARSSPRSCSPRSASPAAGAASSTRAILAVGLVVAVLGSVVPFTLELAALRQISAATFGILLSLEPAVAAFAGAVALSQIAEPGGGARHRPRHHRLRRSEPARAGRSSGGLGLRRGVGGLLRRAHRDHAAGLDAQARGGAPGRPDLALLRALAVLAPEAGRGRRPARAGAERRGPAPYPADDQGGAARLPGGLAAARRLRVRRLRRRRPRPSHLGDDREAARARLHDRGSGDLGPHRRPRVLDGRRPAGRRPAPLPQLQLLHGRARRPRLARADRRDDGAGRPRPERARAGAVGRPAPDGALLHAHLPALPRRGRAGRTGSTRARSACGS